MIAAVIPGRDRSRLLASCAPWMAAAFAGALVGLLLGGLVGLLTPHPYPLDRPAPHLAALATCPEPIP